MYSKVNQLYIYIYPYFFIFFFQNKFIDLFIFGCVGSSLLPVGFL